MKIYSTVNKESHIEQTIEKSKFIAHVKPCKTREEAEMFFKDIRKRYWDATHNVPAMVIGNKMEVEWCSDDGEPSGTSGAPILNILVSNKLTNVALIVTRYFGGIKLGTGGLVRAYSSSAKLALKAAEICDVMEMDVLECKMDYKSFNRVSEKDLKKGSKITGIEYSDVIKFRIICDEKITDDNISILEQITSGQPVVENRSKEVVKIPILED